MLHRLKLNRIVVIGMMVTLLVLLSACGSNGNSNGNANANASGDKNANSAATTETNSSSDKQNATSVSATDNSANAGESATYTYTDAVGRKVEIPTHPKRIITTQYLPEMIAVGVKPVGAATHLLTGYVAIKDQLAGIEDIGVANAPDVEKMLALKPDLIIATEYNKDQLDQWSKIAPTIVVKWEGNDAFVHFKEVASVLGMKDKAEEWIQAYEKKAEDTRAKLAATVKPEETFGVVVIGGYEEKQLRVYGTSNVGYTLYDTLKLPMTDFVKGEMAKGNNEQGLSISLEKLPEFASADRLFLVTFDNDPDFVDEVNKSKLWKNLPAVKAGKVYAVNSDLWFSYDVMSFNAQLDDAVKLLSK
ncbi:ABC transporter substrate-binding protein [Paenibacillus albus]|uniref:Fe3+-hydroxamate ABC transporter substrate-binding protein n=1 Tax=Paenibacillus albus TaxID=2495582 RepID=A0A3Q8X2J0_9BACL|nr:ABC transporter substrate-binding protein [Paenibacillus albus]AZN38971.1 Fe3+-hydroxamate ABC transporter substrate-binding protein [Paenibacillus albus]